jgi:hypothetical protein
MVTTWRSVSRKINLTSFERFEQRVMASLSRAGVAVLPFHDDVGPFAVGKLNALLPIHHECHVKAATDEAPRGACRGSFRCLRLTGPSLPPFPSSITPRRWWKLITNTIFADCMTISSAGPSHLRTGRCRLHDNGCHATLLATGEQDRDLFQEARQLYWLGVVVIASCRDRLFAIAGHCMGRERDHGNIPR